jgi:hypothetical protein
MVRGVIRSSSLAAFAFVVVTVSSSYASAQGKSPQGASVEGAQDLTTLEQKLTAETDALSTSDCANACRALASIRRAADKICALDPGDRCAAGRAKAEDATKRVREACPECAIAFTAPPTSPPTNERREPVMRKSEAPPEPAPVAQSVGGAPPSESRRGGCAGCTTAKTSANDLAGAMVGILAFFVATRRRRSRRSRRDV